MTLVAQASLQYLWDLISAQQLVVLMPLFNVEIPPKVQVIFAGLMWVAAAEIIPTDLIYETLLQAEVEGIPASPKFEEIGLEHHLLL